MTTTSTITTQAGVQSTVVTQWVLSADAPVGTAPEPGSAYLGLVAGPSVINSGLVNDAALGNLKIALATLTASVAAALATGQLAQAQAAQINQALGAAGVAGFPVALAMS